MSKQEESLQQIQTMRENLRILRQSRGWDLEELSARSLIPYATLEAIEQGGEFNMSCLAPLCALYEVEPIELFRPMKP